MSVNSWVLENSGGIAFGVCMVLCVLFYLTCSRCSRRVPAHGAVGGHETGSAANDDGAVLVGAAQVAVDMMPPFPYKHKNKDDAGGGSIENCVVCLSQVAEGEMVRLLPKCKHLFHVGCIDLWLRSHSRCPLCRSDAGAAKPRGAAKVADERGSALILRPPPV